ncbi:MAG TPA: helix-hairpin-helix domain-containing protein [Candidatus Cloacimonadota bacterium]|nr:helix-hairpin-helix domain-containing protein [Candidatus Cloacimonadota bacterium]
MKKGHRHPKVFSKEETMRNPLHNLLTPSEQKALLYVIAILILGCGLQLFGWSPRDVGKDLAIVDSLQQRTKEDARISVDIRKANLEELTLLPGIGEKRAQDILDYRASQPFTSVNQIMLIKGIGKATYLKMKPSLLLFGDDEPLDKETKPSARKSEAKTSGTKVSKDDLSTMVNLNTASMEELCTLSGIGEVKARAIIAYREESGGFKEIGEIMNVKGIGEKTFAKIKARLKI